MQNVKSSFRYETRKEKIYGEPQDVLKFKRQQYYYRIFYAVITGLVGVLGYWIKNLFYPPN
jgi:hypothetical protein